MFEDSTFESNGRIRTRSRGWMIATFLFNGSILFGLVLIPLIYPEALPHQALTFLLTTPPPPPTPPPTPPEATHPFHGRPEITDRGVTVPTRIPHFPPQDLGPEQPAGNPLIAMDPGPSLPGDPNGVFRNHGPANVVRAEVKGPVRVPSSLVAGLLIYKVTPNYPAIAKAAGVQGTIVLQAIISKTGTIENLRVASGPPMLQQASIDAVHNWRYRPYLLNGQPVEVETTINVVFSLGR